MADDGGPVAAVRRALKFTVSSPGCDRVHHITEDDVRTLLGRLPEEVWSRLSAVHFGDRSRGARCLGYVTRGHREIALCALPPRMSLTRFLTKGQTPEPFGARRGAQWSTVAIRRFLLYDVFLHELGHLQVVEPDATTLRRKFARETRAQEFGMAWCKRLWSEPFDHPDPVHNPPGVAELGDEDVNLNDLIRRSGTLPDDAGLFQRLGRELYRGRMEEARVAYERSLALEPSDPWSHLYLGNWHYTGEDFLAAVERFARAAELMPDRAVAFWCLANAKEGLGHSDLADANYRKAVEVEPTDNGARRRLREWLRRSRQSDAASDGALPSRDSSPSRSSWAVSGTRRSAWKSPPTRASSARRRPPERRPSRRAVSPGRPAIPWRSLARCSRRRPPGRPPRAPGPPGLLCMEDRGEAGSHASVVGVDRPSSPRRTALLYHSRGVARTMAQRDFVAERVIHRGPPIEVRVGPGSPARSINAVASLVRPCITRAVASRRMASPSSGWAFSMSGLDVPREASDRVPLLGEACPPA